MYVCVYTYTYQEALSLHISLYYRLTLRVRSSHYTQYLFRTYLRYGLGFRD